jgi:hypothetical protein
LNGDFLDPRNASRCGAISPSSHSQREFGRQGLISS